MELTAITEQKKLYAMAIRIGELMRTAGAEAEKEKKALMKLLVEIEGGGLQLTQSK